MDNNPLRQYFRRPAVYLKLPSGGSSYTDDIVNIPETGELPVFPMTAIDEITARTPDALFNGTAVVELIRSCVPNIVDPWGINSNDLDAILIAIRAASGGDQLEVESTCPKCMESYTYHVNLVGILATLQAADYSKEIEIGDLKIKVRALTFKEMNVGAMGQFEVQKTFAQLAGIQDVAERDQLTHQALEKITHLTMELLSKGIEYIKTPSMTVTEHEFILDFLKHCDNTVYTKIRDYNTELKMLTELKPFDVTCNNCSNEYKQSFTLNPSDFFG